jgi:chemotaxis protein MotB
MSEKKAPPKEEKQKVPAYIVTFSDMITLLLTFFVLLLSMATEQVNDAKFEKGRDALVNAFANIGIKGISISSKNSLDAGHVSALNPTDQNNDHPEEDTMDKVEEVLQRIYKELEKEMDITPAQITGRSPGFRPTSIKFTTGGSKLDAAAVKYLEGFSFNLQQNIGTQKLTMYIVGLAPKEGSLKKQCLLSAKRAQATADFIRKSLPKEVPWKIHSWGAGPGGLWKSSGPVENSEVIIAVLGN